MSSHSTSSSALSSSSSSSTLHSGWLQYHLHTPTSSSPVPDLLHLDGSALPQYYFTLHSTHLSYSLNPSLAIQSPPLGTIALLPSTALQLLHSPAAAADERLQHYVFCLSDCGSSDDCSGGGGSKRAVHVLSAARRSEMEHWLTALRRGLFRIKRHHGEQPHSQHHSNQHDHSEQLSPPARHTAAALSFAAPPNPNSASLSASASTSIQPSVSPSTTRSAAFSLRQPLLLAAPPSLSSSLSLTTVGDAKTGAADALYSEPEWGDRTARKLCCVIC